MRKLFFILAIAIWVILIINIDTVSNMLGFYQLPVYDITGSDLVTRSKAIKQNILVYFPAETHPIVRAQFDKPRVFLVRKNLMENLKETNYAGDRLSCNALNLFFEREREALTALMELGCLIPIDLPEGGVYGGVRVVTQTKFPPQHFTEIGQVSCNHQLSEIARIAIGDQLESLRLLARGTDASTLCREDEVDFSMMLAQQNVQRGDLLAELNNYASAIRKALSCTCP